jgi:transcriptional coactivator HFI1/ADA1
MCVGELNANEFGDLCDNFILVNTATEHAHNTLVCAIVVNIGRDNPEAGLAGWVSAASDKPGGPSASKPTVTSDASEQRVKQEVMAMPPRDRRRMKAVLAEIKAAGSNSANALEDESAASIRTSMEHYYNEMRIKAPQPTATSGTGIKTNWELEIRKRYAQPLFQETSEFPDATSVHARIVPICYEESVPAGTSMECAELVALAAESHVKNFLHDIYNRVRVNGPRFENGAVQGVMTSRYKKKIEREEAQFKAGTLLRDRDNDLLPTESIEAKTRKPLGIADLKLANKVGPGLWNGMQAIGARVNDSTFDVDIEEWYIQRERDGFGSFANMIGKGKHAQPNGDEMDVDDEDTGWEGAGLNDRAELHKTLGSLLTMPA